ncbi:unnamed protein product [marine sediment metagenome]|uniref:Uncharacterized protein n=1 Tax=marine sediment metagenome TaxID=412755 RepID=X0RGS7_9ZZZZ
MMFTPILKYHDKRLRSLSIEQLRLELYRLRNPTTNNRITLAVIEWERERAEEILLEKENVNGFNKLGLHPIRT